MPAKPQPGDDERAHLLELIESLQQAATLLRSHAMKPGNVWLARGELSKIAGLNSEIEKTLESIKLADNS